MDRTLQLQKFLHQRRLMFFSAMVGALSTTCDARPPNVHFLGAWIIARASPAPWATDHQAVQSAEATRLVRATVTFKPDRIDGPTPLACPRLRYRLHASEPEQLFQGSLPRPSAQAQALGFRTSAIETLETGCAVGIDFHFRDARTVLFGLNDVIYMLRKAPNHQDNY